MTKNQKILVGLGIAALVVYVYTRMGKKAQTPTNQAQSQDNKGQNAPTSIENPQLSQTYADVVRSGGGGKNPIRRDKYGMPLVGVPWQGGINPPHLQKMREENFALMEAVKQKYGTEKGGNIGDRLTTKYGTYEYRKKQTGGPLGKGFTTGWDKI